eukprot:7076535-Pyramimonas_sp.AAC.1
MSRKMLRRMRRRHGHCCAVASPSRCDRGSHFIAVLGQGYVRLSREICECVLPQLPVAMPKCATSQLRPKISEGRTKSREKRKTITSFRSQLSLKGVRAPFQKHYRRQDMLRVRVNFRAVTKEKAAFSAQGAEGLEHAFSRLPASVSPATSTVQPSWARRGASQQLLFLRAARASRVSALRNI